MNRKFLYYSLFIVCLAGLSVLYKYQELLFMRPQGFHQWRQCDGAAMARNYYFISMNFFEPRLNMLVGNDGKAVAEFPIVYYISACLYKLFGYHEFLSRLVCLMIFYMGLFYFFLSVKLLLRDWFYPAALTLMLFTSPILIYYGPNFLPDIPALSFTFIGYYYFIRYTQNLRAGNLAAAAIFFALAGMIKITSLIGFGALFGVYAANNLLKTEAGNKWWLDHYKLFFFFAFPAMCIVAWLGFVHYYKTVNQNPYFLTTIRPIWKLTAEQIKFILGRFNWQWLRMWLYRDYLNITPIILALLLFIPSPAIRQLRFWLFFFLIGALAYMLLFFEQFGNHDYYLICIIPFPVFLLAVLLKEIKEWRRTWFNSAFLKTAAVILLCICIYQGRRVYMERLYTPTQEMKFTAMMDIEPYLETIGCNLNSKVISLGDKTPEVSLYLMNRRGWTEADGEIGANEIKALINKGAAFLIIQPEWKGGEEKKQSLDAFLRNKAGEHDGAVIYKLPVQP